jgi:hypothetical protein
MQASLKKSIVNPLTILGLFLFVSTLLLGEQHNFLYYLTAAQLVFMPVMVQMVAKLKSWEQAFISLGMAAAALLTFTIQKEAAIFCAAIYLLATVIIAKKGIGRFLRRGFTNTAEIIIDLGLVYLAVGGAWYFAYIGEIDTGFSPLITWLTAIHFHYSAFLFCISLGLFGRLYKGKGYVPVAAIIATGPILVALGITFSTTIEIVSVVLYIIAIYLLLFMTCRTDMPRLQGITIRLSVGVLCFTILWSLLYAYGNFTGNVIVGIPDMLTFHGMFNSLFFGTFTIAGWALQIPESRQSVYSFPVSNIRGALIKEGKPHPGLVDDLAEYTDVVNLPASISHFYEHTEEYRLFASIQWKPWFKPFAFVYQFVSRQIGQLNLPFSSETNEMTGTIKKVDSALDGRINPRVWRRTIADETIFVAIYSKHIAQGRTYMNIALPLPFSTMAGILSIEEREGQLHLTSSGLQDEGVYLAIGRYVMKLPLQEHFAIKEERKILKAVHDMKIFGIPFLHIDYSIIHEKKAH